MQKNSVKNKQENTFSNTFWVGFSRQRFPVTRSRAAAVRYVFVDQQGSETSHTQTLISIYRAGRYHGDCLFCFCFLTSTSSAFHCGRATLHYRRAADWELKPLEMHGPVRQDMVLSVARAESPPQTGFPSSSPGRKTMTFKPSGDLLKQPRRVSPAAAEPDRSSAHCIIGLISAGRPWAPPPAWYTNNITHRLECNSYWAAWQIAARPGENWKSWRGLRYLTVTVTMMKYPPVTVVDFAKYERSP